MNDKVEAAKKRAEELRRKAERDHTKRLHDLEKERAAMRANIATTPSSRRP